MTIVRWPVLLTTLLLMGSATPVSADPELGLSVDGAAWTSDLTVPLFDPDIRWVPGDTRTATFHVRNSSGDPAVLSVDVLGTQSHTLLDTGDLTISAKGGGSPWRDVSTPGTHRLVSDVEVGSGTRTPIDIAVAFSPTANNQSMRRELDLRFRIRLTQGAAATGTAADLPGTGGPPAWLLLLGVTLTAAGILRLSRRTPKEDAHA